MRVRRVIFAIVGIALLVSIITPVAVSADTEDNLGKASKKMLKDATKIDEIIVPGLPPGERISEAPVSSFEIRQADAVLSDVPAFDWCYGCSATSAAMMFGYYDRTGYSNMYAGPTNGGVCPLDNSDWGYKECSLSATHQGYDDLAVKGHVDDYWSTFGSTVDPYDGNWAEHGYADCTADFMGTNQYVNWQNKDGSTRFYFKDNGDPLYDYTDCEPGGKRDGCHGIKLFVESRGYNVIQNYNQRIDKNVTTGGFTYANFKAEIDAGRPVIIQVTGHSMLGYGYTDPDTIYIHDTWDHTDHSMTWGGTYAGMEHYGVTVIVMPYPCGNMNVNPTSWNPTILCGNTDNEIVSVSATGGTIEGVTVSKVSGPTWLSVSQTDLGDIASGSSKTFTMTASPPSETSGDFPYTVRVSNTCGTPSTWDVSGTIHVDCPESSWTFMVYLDGDNNLEYAAIDDFLEMSSVGTTSNVNIVVQFDRIPGYDSSYGDWTTCKRFRVTHGMTPTAANAISDLGECNMGDPNTLDAFVTWAMTEFPADNYALILWNHGDGWKSINNWVPWADDIKDAKDTGFTRGICVDITNNDYLSLQETEQALTGKYVQLLGYDACLMHMVEVVYQVMANAGVSVGSEELEPGDGWPYDTILTDLTVTPTMNEDALGTVIVDRYMDSYGYTGSETQSAVDNLELPNLVAAVDNLAQALINEINAGHVADVQQARNAAEEIYYTYYIDLYHFAEMVDTYVPGAAAEAQAVMNEVGVAVYGEAHGTSVPNDHGLSIYFPEAEWAYLSSYENTKFAVDTHWDEFLKEYYAPTICGNMDVAPTSWSPTINCGESDSQIVTVSASGGMIRGVTVSKVSVPAWLSLSPTNLGDIASGSSKTFTITASPTASLSSGTRGDFAYTVRVSNSCGSPSTRDVSGSIHVDCIEPSQPPSYSNPSVSPCSGTPSTQFDYSVDVSDPEGDTVTVTLKTYDPSDGSWEDQGNRNVIGSGTVFWNDLTPFEANDKGKTAKYTFEFDDGNNSGEWGPFNGPAIETDACFSDWDYPSTSIADEKIPVEVDMSNPHGVKSAWLHYDYGDDGSEDGLTQMSLICVRGAKTEIRGGSSSGLGVKAQKIAVSESAPLSGGGGSGVAEREGIQKSIYLYDAKTCKDVEDSDPYDPIGVTTVFSPTDSVSYTWLQFNDIWSSHTVKWEWYDPNGNFYADCTYLIPDPSDLGYEYHEWYKCWCGIYITGYSAAEEEGLWAVKVYLDGGQIETLYFNIEYIISDYTMCKDVQESSPYDPIERTSTFLSNDEKAISWLRLDDVTNSLNVRWDWYDPLGNPYYTWDLDTSDPADEGYDYWDWTKAWCYIPIKDHAAAEKPGLWVVKVYIDDEYEFEEEFTIYPDDARYKCEIPAPGMGYVEDEVSFYVRAYSAYDSPTDSAKHLVDIYVPDDPTLSISPSSHDFGDKCEGEMASTTFEIWNSGTGTLTYSLSESCDWMEVNPTSGSSTGEHDTIRVDIDTTGLSEGTHTCDITISSNGGTGTFTVRVNIVPKPDLIITEKWLCWPDNCTICYNVTNTGDGTAPAGHNTTLYVDSVAVAHDHVPVDLAPGESYIGCFDGYVWAYTPPSDNITVCADNNKTIDEVDEDNNCLANIWMCGDVTGDGRVRTSDGRRIFRHLTFGVPIDNMWAADVTGDGRVRTSDGRRIFRHLTFGDPLNCNCSG